MRFINDDNRAIPGQQIGKAALYFADVAGLKRRMFMPINIGLRYTLKKLAVVNQTEMRLKIFLVRIHIAACGVIHAQRLHRRDDHNRTAAEILRTELLTFGDVDHREAISRVVGE